MADTGNSGQPYQPPQIFCPNCRGGNAYGALQCQWCGYSLISQPQPSYSPPPPQPPPVVVNQQRASGIGQGFGIGMGVIIAFTVMALIGMASACFICYLFFLPA